jgi:heterodisulfide reductase subunit B
MQPFALFWGCLIPLRLPWIEVTAREVLPKLGIEIRDFGFSCCPDPILTKSLDGVAWLSLAARNLVIAESEDLNILTLCSGCFETFLMAQNELRNEERLVQVNRILTTAGSPAYTGKCQVFHFQQWCYHKLGIQNLSSLIHRSVHLKIATHVGCHYMRPAEVMKTDHPIYPEELDELCEIAGLEPVDYPEKTLCCGAGTRLVDSTITYSMLERKVKSAMNAGAEAFVTHCPACILTFDSFMLSHDTAERLPVFHLLELLGMAMGIKPDQLALQEHRITIPQRLIEQMLQT